MKNLRFCVFVFAFGALLSSIAAHADKDVLDKLNSLSGVEAIETTTDDDRAAGYQRYAIQFEQWADHTKIWVPTFKQKLVLFHKGFDEPMLMHTSGYKIFSEKLSRITKAFQTNQLQVEHRFFDTSTPNPKDWTLMNVEQSAYDFHRIVLMFRQLYHGAWVNNGASKGGMTSIFYRRFFPNEIEGTVADVAPLSFTTEDKRYIDWVENVGGEAYGECRKKLENYQDMALQRRQEVLPTLTGSYTILGGKEASFEHSVIESSFTFWQYGNPDDASIGCGNIPTFDTPTNDFVGFLKAINDPADYGDEQITVFQPYYYQSANELGGPASKLSHLMGKLLFPYNLEMYLPDHKPVTYTDVTMKDMKEWVANDSHEMMFIYGEYDPWTAGAYTDVNKKAGSDNHWYKVAKGNHGSNFTLLDANQKAESLAVMSRWFKKAPVNAFINKLGDSLEDDELKILRHHKM